MRNYAIEPLNTLRNSKEPLALAQHLATEQGRLFEQNCALALRCAGFCNIDTHVTVKQLGVEIDLVATSQADVPFYFTCKGSMRGTRPGTRRTDTLKKALCDSFLLSQYGWTPVVLLTSHIPDHGSGKAMLEAVTRNVLFDVLNPWMHGERLQWMARANKMMLKHDLQFSLPELCSRQWHQENPTSSQLVNIRDKASQLELFTIN